MLQHSEDVGDEPVFDPLGVVYPEVTVALPALAVHLDAPGHQHHHTQKQRVVGQHMAETTGQGNCQGAQQVTQIVGVADKSPQSRNQKLVARLVNQVVQAWKTPTTN